MDKPLTVDTGVSPKHIHFLEGVRTRMTNGWPAKTEITEKNGSCVITIFQESEKLKDSESVRKFFAEGVKKIAKAFLDSPSAKWSRSCSEVQEDLRAFSKPWTPMEACFVYEVLLRRWTFIHREYLPLLAEASSRSAEIC